MSEILYGAVLIILMAGLSLFRAKERQWYLGEGSAGEGQRLAGRPVSGDAVSRYECAEVVTRSHTRTSSPYGDRISWSVRPSEMAGRVVLSCPIQASSATGDGAVRKTGAPERPGTLQAWYLVERAGEVNCLPEGPSGQTWTQPTLQGSDRWIGEGLKRLKAADYRGAVDAFRAAVVESDGDVRATAHFALGLILVGDGKNADKALRAAADAGRPDKIDVRALFKDAQEEARIKGTLAAVEGDGRLTAAWIEFLFGTPERLRRLSEKDPVAGRLLASGGESP